MLNEWIRKLNKARDLMRSTSESAHLHNVSFFRMMNRVSSLYFSRDFSQAEIFGQGLTDPSLSGEDLEKYVSKESIWPTYEKMNKCPEQRLVDDKLEFQYVCLRNAIPVPDLLDVYTPNSAGTTSAREEKWKATLERQFPDSFVAKPTLGLKGAGVLLISRQGGLFNTQAGEKLTTAELLRKFDQAGTLPMIHPEYKAEDQRVIFQSRLIPHSALASLSGKDLVHCIRICTALDVAGQAKLVFCFVKIIAGKNNLDTFDQGKSGNLLGFIDPQTGEICRAIGRRPGNTIATPIECHPDTGVSLIGFVVPQWNAIVDLAMMAARAFSPVGMIGWDIALTTSGPVLLEGNTTWDPVAPFELASEEISRWATARLAQLEK